MLKKGENNHKRNNGCRENLYIISCNRREQPKLRHMYGKADNEGTRRLAEMNGSALRHTGTAAKRTLTYNKVLDAWLNSSKLNIKESTFARYTHSINAHIRPHLGKFQISKITTQLIEAHIEQLLEHGRLDNAGGLSAKTVSDILVIIKSTIEYARYNNLPVACNLEKLSVKKKKKKCVFSHKQSKML